MPERLPGLAIVPAETLGRAVATMWERLHARRIGEPLFSSVLEAGGGLLIVAGRPVQREGDAGRYLASALTHGDDFEFALHGEPGIDIDAVCLHWGLLEYRTAVTPEQHQQISGHLQWRPPKQGPG